MSKDNLYNKEAKQKIQKLAESIDFCMLQSNLKSQPIHSIPMSTKKVDDDGNIWFLSGADSDHNSHIKSDNNIQLIYSDASDMEFLTIYGKAEITRNKSILEDLYGKSDDMWFEGLDDPNLTAIKFIPKDAYYWEPKNNKLVTLFKMGVGAVTGDQPDLGEHGSINP